MKRLWFVRLSRNRNKVYTPFEGLELTGWVKSTFLRGKLIYDKGQILGSPSGRYWKRPYGVLPNALN